MGTLTATQAKPAARRAALVSKRLPLIIFVTLVFLFLTLPLLVVVPVSFSSASFITFPPPGYSLRWYEAYLNDYAWMAATIRSLKVGVVTTVLALAFGVPLSFALVRGRFPGRALLEQGIAAPLIVPNIVFSIAVFGFYYKLGLVGPWLGVAVAHTILALPFVVIVTTAGLRAFDRNLELAAMGLGASRLGAVMRVTLPDISPSLISAAFLAFITSFDELVVAMFLAGADATLPKKMFESIMTAIDPTVAAVSVLQILLVSVLMIAVTLLGGRVGGGRA
ncbi:ABC transporter permease [Tropicimonas isoalkanivorans]|uniref:Putative spermidine/putrescine transport system permease protein n=1 Tax=Tropicimonas isoalkanivorans TaxID=441112 RepID=A0A1I1HSY8_9RHOB|nr:ABC transporter permease [Tropicimonas isoalkanivorans]SFC26915.1 putative spermidine/putrescine transport system permease protein [Tropicimonas isoalkanivorans]